MGSFILNFKKPGIYSHLRKDNKSFLGSDIGEFVVTIFFIAPYFKLGTSSQQLHCNKVIPELQPSKQNRVSALKSYLQYEKLLARDMTVVKMSLSAKELTRHFDKLLVFLCFFLLVVSIQLWWHLQLLFVPLLLSRGYLWSSVIFCKNRGKQTLSCAPAFQLGKFLLSLNCDCAQLHFKIGFTTAKADKPKNLLSCK